MHRYKVTFSNGNTCTIDAKDGWQAFDLARDWFLEIGVHVSKSNFTVEFV